jgi:hypothetical protein
MKMARKKHLVKKSTKKRIDGKCKFCSCEIYELLDLHRIVEGKDGGEYTAQNTVTVCALCHRKVHAGFIKIDRWYPSISGKMILHYWMDGEEKYD